MKTQDRIQVFLAYSAIDADVARVVESTFTEAGLGVVRLETLASDKQPAGTLWEALTSSDALVAIISEPTLALPNVSIEIGAAMAWHKPIYVITKSASVRLPSFLAKYPVYPLNRASDVARSIREGFQTITEKQRQALKEVYREIDVPTDQLAVQPSLLEELSQEFKKRTHATMGGDRLLRELLRLRKAGKLPKLREVSTPSGA